MHILLNKSSMVPIYEQLMDQIKNEIIDGNLPENEVLPSVRALSASLRISSLTVKKAYDKLEEEGFVVTVHGKGTYVAAGDRQSAMEARRRAVEDDLAAAVQKAVENGFTKEEIHEIIDIILEDH